MIFCLSVTCDSCWKDKRCSKIGKTNSIL
ncbi:MAG: hypothetical protein ACFFBD_00675 [Candidatus Hodarchaeota archaeon]